MGFLRNIWYAAAWSDELSDKRLFARTIADVPIVMYRSADGTIAALMDRCPHRFAPLSRGQLVDHSIRCGYHGLTFSSAGRCVHNPHGPELRALQVSSYRCEERHNIIWLWMGEAAQAATEEIPDLSLVSSSTPTAYFKGYLPTQANHQLLVDNILDLTHADYLHADTLGGGSISRSKPSLEIRGNRVFVQWLSHNEPPLPVFRAALPDPDMKTDMFTEVLWYPGGAMHLSNGAAAVGARRGAGIVAHAAHIMTPETGTSTHYFYAVSRNYKTDDAAYNAAFTEGIRQAFSAEDKPMIEAQQARLGVYDLMDLKPVLLEIDRASVAARRIYSELLSLERS